MCGTLALPNSASVEAERERQSVNSACERELCAQQQREREGEGERERQLTAAKGHLSLSRARPTTELVNVALSFSKRSRTPRERETLERMYRRVAETVMSCQTGNKKKKKKLGSRAKPDPAGPSFCSLLESS